MKNVFKTASLMALATGLCLSVAPQAKAQSIEFECQYDADSQLYSTAIAGTDNAVILWTETLGSDQPLGAYTPARRCNAVSTRLTNLSKSLGITDLAAFSELGYSNGEMVIFNSRHQGDLNATYPADFGDDEVVFTLSPGNHLQSDALLERFQYRVAPVGGSDLPENALFPIVE